MVVLMIGREPCLEAAADCDAKSTFHTKTAEDQARRDEGLLLPSSEPAHGAWLPVSVRNYHRRY
jgi:hypothetical protein